MTLELNVPEKVILATGDTAAKYKISDICLEYDVIIDKCYSEIISKNYIEMSIPYTNVKKISHDSKSKKDQDWVIDINIVSQSLQGVLLLFKDTQTDFAYKNEEFYNPTFTKILVTIDGDTHQIYKGGLLPKDIYSEVKRYFHHQHSDVDFEQFLTTKFALWIDTRSSQENTLHGSGRTVLKNIKLQLDKVPETGGGIVNMLYLQVSRCW